MITGRFLDSASALFCRRFYYTSGAWPKTMKTTNGNVVVIRDDGDILGMNDMAATLQKYKLVTIRNCSKLALWIMFP